MTRAIADVRHPRPAHWLWPGAPITADMRDASALFLLQGHVSGATHASANFVRQGMAPHPIDGPPLHLVYRLDILAGPEALADEAGRQAKAWRRHGARVDGMQIDFDAASLHLGGYRHYLRQLRAALSGDLDLSITGLADWRQSSATRELAALHGCVDDIAFQLYNGRTPLPAWTRHARSLSSLPRPFRIGLLPGMTLPDDVRSALTQNPHFRGLIYFHSALD